MMDLASIKAAAVARGCHACALCGRPCKPEEARRHTEPGAFGDGPEHFAPVCYVCQTWLAHAASGGPLPARYVAHLYEGGRLRRRVRLLAHAGFLAVLAMVYAALGALAAAALWGVARDPIHVLMAGILALWLLWVLRCAAAALTGGLREPDLPSYIRDSARAIREEANP